MRTVRLFPALCAGLVLAAAGAAAAQTPAPTDAERAARIRSLINQLGNADWQERDAAQAELLAIGKPAVPALERALADNPDPEIRMRCEAILHAVRTGRWDVLLPRALDEDEELHAQLEQLWDHIGGFSETAFRRPGACTPIVVEDVDRVLVEPARFYALGGEVFGAEVKPRLVFRIGLTEGGRVFLTYFRHRRYDGVPNLRRVLKPAANPGEALKVAELALQALVLCPDCSRDAKVRPERCRVETLPAGGYRVEIPVAALDPNRGAESALVTFDGAGRLEEVKSTGHPGGHR